MKRLVGSDQETLRIHERLVAGSLAGAIAQSSIYPMEVRATWVLEWAVPKGHREERAVLMVAVTLVAGAEDPNGPAEDRPVLRHAGLRQEDLG